MNLSEPMFNPDCKSKAVEICLFLFVTLTVLLFGYSDSHAQISVGGTPPSFSSSVSSAVQTVTMALQSNDDLMAAAESALNDARSRNDVIPYQIAEPIPVNINLNSAGTWETLADGSRLWRLRISSPGATAMHIIYDEWQIPKHAQLFVYNDSHTRVFGAYMTPSNPEQSTGVTPIIAGDATTIEYHVGVEAPDEGAISISDVLHHFRAVREEDNPLDAYGDSQPCHINVNCPSGVPWNLQRNAVIVIYTPSGGQCSGALINNTRNDGEPYVFSAAHCYPTGFGSGFLFQYRFQSPGCANTMPPDTLISGTAYVTSRWVDADFLLLQMADPPPIAWNPYFAGWDKTGNIPSNIVSIHHPRGDIKKISMKNSAPYSADWNGNYPDTHWRFDTWDSGETEPGSSGSPWFNSTGLVVGQLHGGSDSTCNMTGSVVAGKFSSAWTGGGDSGNRLSDYLDPGVGNNGTLAGFQPVQPSNDLPCNATNIAVPYSTNGNTNYATAQILNCQDVSAPDVWFKLTVPCSTYVTVTTCGSYFDTELYIYRGSCTGFFEEIGCNDDDPNLYCQINPVPGASRLQFWAQPFPEDYYIQVSGYGGQSGVYYLNVTGVSTIGNDACPGFLITDLPYLYTGSTTCATDLGGGVCAPDGGSPDVNFRFIPTCDGWVDVSTCGSTFDTQFDIYQIPYPGNCGSGGSLLGCNDDGGECLFNPYASFLHTYVYANNIYDISLQGYNGASGFYRLSIVPSVPGDNCANPIQVFSPLPFNHSGDTRCVMNDFTGCVDTQSADMIYSYYAQSCHIARVSLCGSSFDTSVRVLTGGICPGTTEIACNDDFCGLQSRLDFNAVAGQTYYIIVAGYVANEGLYSLNVSDVGAYYDPHDGCTGVNFTSLPYSAAGTTVCATGYSQTVHCGGAVSNDVIYTMQLTECMEVTASSCGSSFDTRIDIRMDAPCPGATPVICNDDNFCGGIYTLQSSVTWQAQANVGYRILLHGYGGQTGNYALNVTGIHCPGPDDVVSVVGQPNPNDISLSWGTIPNALSYDVYYSVLFETLYDPSNFYINTASPNAVISGVLDDPANIGFFGVIAQLPDGGAVLAFPGEEENLPPKEMAVQGEINIPWDLIEEIENVEFALPDKATQTEK